MTLTVRPTPLLTRLRIALALLLLPTGVYAKRCRVTIADLEVT